MRLIDADRLKRVLIAFFTGAHLELPHISKVIDFLDNAPTVDAVEVVHGRWKKSNDYGAHAFTRFYGICSACSFQVGYDSAVHYHYCPNCGAKMDEVSE